MTLSFNSIEICAGAGGQALGLEQAGFNHVALVEIDKNARETLMLNRPQWNLFEDVKTFDATGYKGIVDLLAGGVPCPPFSIAGKQLGADDERDLFPEALRLVKECDPKAVMLENVRGLLDARFEGYRASIIGQLEEMGYKGEWFLLNACDYGVPQLRPRAILVALKEHYWSHFNWPSPTPTACTTVGSALLDEMASNGWAGALEWSKQANRIAPTLVGGSKKHGGPDLGPTRSKRAWAELGVDGMGIANEPPQDGFEGMPRLTVRMAAIIQGFPNEWKFSGKKTASYRQVGNAFPPPVSKAVGMSIRDALKAADIGCLVKEEMVG